MRLRDYQSELIESVRVAFRSGYLRPLAVLPPGGGKTVCFAYMAHQHVMQDPSRRVWFLVHRRELIDQARETFTTWGLTDAHIYVGMVQTMSRRLVRGITPTDTPTLIIYDEAHHATSTTWRRIIEAYPRVPTVGLTATPLRLDGEGLGAVFDSMVVGRDAEWLTSHGYLAPYDYYAPSVLDLQTVSYRGYDYNMDEVTEVLLKSHIYGDIKKYIHPDRKTIIYAPSIALSRSLESTIPGVVHFDANTPTHERDRIIRDFRDGRIRALSNVDLIGEGFNVPDCDAVVMLRPTQSLALYIQQSMRCMRPFDGKRAVVYDLVGNCYRHGLPTDPHAWSLDGRIRSYNPSAEPDITCRECHHCYRVYAGIKPICPYCGGNNGKTRNEIKADEKAELERVESVKRIESKKQQGRAQTYEQLVALGVERGYKNPRAWARHIISSRANR